MSIPITSKRVGVSTNTFLPSSINKTHALTEHQIENNRFTTFCNAFIVLRIYLTFPVTIASGERRFSKLKLIKTYLRSTTSQQRLINFAMISIENATASNHCWRSITRHCINIFWGNIVKLKIFLQRFKYGLTI